MKELTMSLSFNLKHIKLISIDEIILKTTLEFFGPEEDEIFENLFEVGVEFTINNQNIENVFLDKEKLEILKFSKEAIEKTYEQLLLLLENYKKDFLKITEHLRIKEIYDLNDLEYNNTNFIGEKYHFSNKTKENYVLSYHLYEKTNKLYLMAIKDVKKEKPIFLTPPAEISEELIKKSTKFRLNYLFKHYKTANKKT